MASGQEVKLRRITEDIQCMSAMLTPLTSLDANSHDDLHAKPHNFNPVENRLLPYLTKRHADDNVVKATLMRKPVGDDVREEPNKFKTADNVSQQSWKSFVTTDLYKKAIYGEKENLESAGLVRAKESSKPTIGSSMPGFTDVKKLQEGFEVSSKPLTLLEINVRDEINLADSGPDISIGDGKPLNECNTISRQELAKIVLEKSKGFLSRKRQPDPRLDCFVPDSSMQPPLNDTRERVQPLTVLVHENMKDTPCDLCSHSVQTMKAPLLSQFQDRSEQESLCGLATKRPGFANSRLLPPKQGRSTQNCAENPGYEWRQYIKTAKTSLAGQSKAQGMEESSCSLRRPKLLKSSVLSQLESQSTQVLQTFEEISTQNNDHVVVLFSVQNILKDSAASISRQQLLKLSSLCMQYSRKILSWITSLGRKQKIEGGLRRLQQIFSSSPRGFVDLNCQKLPEFSTKMCPLSSKRKLAKDDELKAVLMKINEVLTSMDRTPPDSMQESTTDYGSERAADSLCTA